MFYNDLETFHENQTYGVTVPLAGLEELSG